MRIFAEKQIYIRSKSGVSYISLSSPMQLLLFALFVGLCGWVGFASVNTMLHNEIMARHEQLFLEKQFAYEENLNRLQLDYDNLNGELSLMRDWFNETTATLETRHKELTRLLERHTQISATIKTMQNRLAHVIHKTRPPSSKIRLVAHAKRRETVLFHSRPANTRTTSATLPMPDNTFNMAQIKTNMHMTQLSETTPKRIEQLYMRQQDLLNALEESTDRKIAELNTIIEKTEVLHPDPFMAKILPDGQRHIGGPYIPLENTHRKDSALQKQFFRISRNIDYLADLSQAIRHIPLAHPIHHSPITSNFGPRIDPFRNRAAFHSGIDFGVAIGTPVHATLGGRVSYSGMRGPYGLVVEIKHANGFKTRYAHLSKTQVQRGQVVSFQDIIGESGNSGRSTGPHLHYEIWYKGKIRNPKFFFNAGKHIFNPAEIRKFTN